MGKDPHPKRILFVSGWQLLFFLGFVLVFPLKVIYSHQVQLGNFPFLGVGPFEFYMGALFPFLLWFVFKRSVTTNHKNLVLNFVLVFLLFLWIFFSSFIQVGLQQNVLYWWNTFGKKEMIFVGMWVLGFVLASWRMQKKVLVLSFLALLSTGWLNLKESKWAVDFSRADVGFSISHLYATEILVIITVFLYFLLKSKFLKISTLAISLLSQVVFGSLSAALSFVGSIPFILVSEQTKKRYYLIFLIFFTVLIGPILLVYGEYVLVKEKHSILARLDYLKINISIIKENFLFGDALKVKKYNDAHNILSFWSNFGIVGFVLAVLSLITSFFAIRCFPSDSIKGRVAFVLLVYYSFKYFIASSWGYTTPWFVWGFIFGIGVAIKRVELCRNCNDKVPLTRVNGTLIQNTP